ncbi:NADH-quinone oxidoreductase subunit N [Sphingobacterium corticibacterium]|uniref:NADH-quinone oxidoreductase subunit N n=1 Tax=Sphingobacterium corticibacterium TaxID=2484746 RepID=A0A4Q6XQ61_9SPHI|nr:NADH-quinone oxidoreductase subunit N [Sphingobacterium corticibacterium]RZF59552.1 NADH-quinone oxidoreductase subunit N [Sphingobacterium corticibacterium]
MNVSIPNILDQIIASVPLFKPELALIIGFIVCIFTALFLEKRWRNSTFIGCIVTLGFSLYYLIGQLSTTATGFSGMWLVDTWSTYARLVVLCSTVIIAIFLQQQHSKNNGDVYSILIAATLGMHVLSSTSHWLMAFIGIEMVSIASYILVGYFSQNKTQSEAAMKYVLFGSVCAAVMLYGLSLVYGLTGNLDFQSAEHLQGLMDAPEAIITLALLFVFAGIGFKLSFVPFHVWSPDVYQGAPTAITAFLSTIPKIGAIILFARLYQSWSSTAFYFSELSTWFITIVAIVTMLVGNLAALRQQDVKRMMAYSSIGHTGLLLMAVFAYQDLNSYLLFYIVAYVLMNLATFIFIDQIEQQTGSTSLLSYTGLGKKMPILFTAFTLVAISLIGIPPTVGFVAKLMVFTSTFSVFQSSGDTGALLLLIIGALTSAISLFFYFKIPLYAFLRNSDQPVILKKQFGVLLVIAYILTVLVILFGIFPNWVMQVLA